MKFTKININLNYLTYKFKKKKINPLKIKNPKKNFEIKNYYSFNDSFDIMPPTLESHIEEFRDRLILSLISLIVSCLISLSFAKELLLILQYPSITENIIFLQLSPGEFFFTSVEISAYFGFIASIPSIIFHFICYILPGLTRTEKEFLLPLIFYSVVLFLFG